MTKEASSKVSFFSVSSKLRKYNATELETGGDRNNFLGLGEFGAGRICHHKEIGKVVAKCFAIFGSKNEIKSNLKKIIDEVNVLSRCQHEGIVEVLGYTRWANNIAILMNYVDGGNLKDLLSRVHELAWCIRLQIAQQTSSALCYLHYKDPKKIIVHGDLKPKNILLTRALQVKLADFGAASRVALADATAPGVTLPSELEQFTHRYAAPEFLDSLSRKQYPEGHPSMDMYSFGGILFELLTYHRFDLQQLNEVESVVRQLYSDQDRLILLGLKTILMNCLTLNRELRPNSKEVSDLLGKVLDTINKEDIRHAVEEIFPVIRPTNQQQESPMVKLSGLRYPFNTRTAEAVNLTLLGFS